MYDLTAQVEKTIEALEGFQRVLGSSLHFELLTFVSGLDVLKIDDPQAR